jgi:ADP-heptose:LPS heptosyltransferase
MESPAVPDHWRALGRDHLLHHGIVGTQPLVFLHPGSGSIHKCVGPDVLAAVIERLRGEGLEPLILEGPADRELVARLYAHVSPSPTVFRGMDLRTLVGMLAHAQLYIGHDSGVMHLAALFGVPTLALFGPTDPARWAPRGAHVSILRGSPCSCASWEAVRQCVERPCLQLSPEIIMAHCLALRLKGATPGNTSRCALSLPTPYARVAS